ncbi:ion channel [Microbacterium hydrocarbonoxydans]|uniref:Ion channel n=1 Tax=Microbacterium hydrocarbonoxydans TaxID=273678 RepID=A0A1H4P7R3_9MICO|nr:ion channel [Microbacterium hydrocarbonoxydans]SEC03477.1 Ion channel [Microbacterium hydrocarbonoxydans]
MRSDTSTHPPVRPRGAHVAATPSGWRSGYWVVLALLVATYALCAAQHSADPSPTAFVIQLLTVAAVLRVTEVHARAQQVAWVALGVAGIAAIVVALLGMTGMVLDIALSVASTVAFLVAPVAIIRHQVMRRGLDTEALLAAISAYVLVGMFFTLVYNLAALLTGAPAFGDGVVDSLSTQLFFSFTTLTTTGYGNIVPASPGIQTIAVAEAITGQLFLITAVARIMRGSRRSPDETLAAPAPAGVASHPPEVSS